ncbi:MAG: aminotransferase class I/II-fold pyridoxal phosphate-dependent enzyme [Saccharofermentanales bacterium]
MISYSMRNKNELKDEAQTLERQYLDFKVQGNKLNMARGKPCKEQLMLSNGMLECVLDSDIYDSTGFDCRNYGILDGLPEAKQLFADLLEISADKVIVGGNSSLNMMYDTVARAMLFGMKDSDRPWSREEKITFLCPSPGYDRHFALTASFGISMIAVPMTSEGPDMDIVEKLAGSDSSVRGIWCVPLYSNPDGITYSEETCRRIASMKTMARDFTILWDNSYFVHHLHEDRDSIPDIIGLCESSGNPNRVYEFASTSKITWAGAGIACVASSVQNVAFIKSHMTFQTIGPDKINQLRHVRFLKDTAGVIDMMKKHEVILKPKFDTVLGILQRELGDTGIARWNVPRGGYFISLFVQKGTAKEVVRLCKECGVELTPAGATYPYGVDPDDSNIRIAPSFPPIAELSTAIEILCVAVKLAAVRIALDA